MDFEWDQARSEQNEAERRLPFELAALLFEGPVIEHVDDRRAYGEARIRAVGAIAGSTLHCVYTMRGGVRRIISLRYANKKERDAYCAAYPG
jgi:uncharacterized protein